MSVYLNDRWYKTQLRDVIENHRANNNYGFRAEDISGLIEGGAAAGRAAIWQDIISGQLDADRMDYLLRDSHHAGIEYGKYDWRRIVSTVQLVPDPESGTLRFGVSESGRHAAEALIIARYMMFNQVYFHKTRVILDFHFHRAMKSLLPDGAFPPPTPDGIQQYLEWDDWKVVGKLAAGEGGEHGDRLRNRDFFRQVWKTPEFPSYKDAELLKKVDEALGDMVAARCSASKSWYKVGDPDLPIATKLGTRPLSQESTIVGSLQPTNLTYLYVAPDDRAKADEIIKAIRDEGK